MAAPAPAAILVKLGRRVQKVIPVSRVRLDRPAPKVPKGRKDPPAHLGQKARPVLQVPKVHPAVRAR
jgi:hypothetical protein